MIFIVIVYRFAHGQSHRYEIGTRFYWNAVFFMLTNNDHAVFSKLCNIRCIDDARTIHK